MIHLLTTTNENFRRGANCGRPCSLTVHLLGSHRFVAHFHERHQRRFNDHRRKAVGVTEFPW